MSFLSPISLLSGSSGAADSLTEGESAGETLGMAARPDCIRCGRCKKALPCPRREEEHAATLPVLA